MNAFRKVCALVLFVVADVLIVYAMSDEFGRWIPRRLAMVAACFGAAWLLGRHRREVDAATELEDAFRTFQWIAGLPIAAVAVLAPAAGVLWLAVVLGVWWLSLLGIRYTLCGVPQPSEPAPVRGAVEAEELPATYVVAFQPPHHRTPAERALARGKARAQ